MFERWLSRENRKRAREIAADSWVTSSFDEALAIKLGKQTVADDKSKGTYGNILVAVMVAYYVALLVQLGIKYWKSKQIKHPPAQSEPGEPFGLTGGAS